MEKRGASPPFGEVIYQRFLLPSQWEAHHTIYYGTLDKSRNPIKLEFSLLQKYQSLNITYTARIPSSFNRSSSAQPVNGNKALYNDLRPGKHEDCQKHPRWNRRLMTLWAHSDSSLKFPGPVRVFQVSHIAYDTQSFTHLSLFSVTRWSSLELLADETVMCGRGCGSGGGGCESRDSLVVVESDLTGGLGPPPGPTPVLSTIIWLSSTCNWTRERARISDRDRTNH